MMTVRIGIGVGCRMILQLACIYMILNAMYGNVNNFILVPLAFFMIYSKLKSAEKEIKNDVGDFVGEYYAYPSKNMTKDQFVQKYEVLDSTRYIYVRRQNPLAALLITRLYFAAVKESDNGEMCFHETYYDYL